jgi:GDP-fucose transporter C1
MAPREQMSVQHLHRLQHGICVKMSAMKVVGAIAFYWVASIALVFLNKVALVGIEGFDAPLFSTWTQLVVAVVGCAGLAQLRGRKGLEFFPQMEYDHQIAYKVMPLSLIFLGMIVFNNLCLKYVEVSFYHVARALSVVFNVALTYIMFDSKVSKACIASLVIVVFGYILGCDGEIHFSLVGVCYGVLSSVFVALYSNYVKKTLPCVDNNSWRLMIYNNINSAILLPILIFFSGEYQNLLGSLEVFRQVDYWTITCLTGIFGFLINIATFLQIQMTSPLTHNVSGIAKATAQTGLAYLIFKNPVSFKGVLGLFVVLGGSFAYGFFRKAEMDAKSKALAEESDLEADSDSSNSAALRKRSKNNMAA